MKVSHRSRRWLGRAALAVALALAMVPAWRALMLPDKPTFDELAQLICTTPPPAGRSGKAR